MRFLKTVMLAAATAGVMATQASAQTAVSVQFNQSPSVAVVTNNTGGAWYADITGTGISLQDAIVYCFDSTRNFNPGQAAPYSYGLYTFSQFLNQVAGASAPSNVNPWNKSLTTNDLNAMADLALGYNQPGWTAASNGQIQLDIWAISNNPGNSGAVPGNFDTWRVLYNGQNQTFLVQVPPGSTVTPEPSTYALMAAGLAGLFMANRRRRQNNA